MPRKKKTEKPPSVERREAALAEERKRKSYKQIDFTELRVGTTNHRGRKIVKCPKCGKNGEKSSISPMITHKGTERQSGLLLPKLNVGAITFNPTVYCML
jgi:hypothetical protein